MNILPVIRIQDAWLLRENVSPHLHDLPGAGRELPDNRWMAQRVAEYRSAWHPIEKPVLRGMTEALGLSFRQNAIDVYVAPNFNVIGNPLIIGTTQDPDIFTDILTHELIHRLLTDNTTLPFEMRLRPEWERLFGKRPYAELVHIPVNAVHTALYLDVLEAPQLLARNIDLNRRHKDADLIRAWEYVTRHDYMKIIKQVRQSYKRLAQ